MWLDVLPDSGPRSAPCPGSPGFALSGGPQKCPARRAGRKTVVTVSNSAVLEKKGAAPETCAECERSLPEHGHKVTYNGLRFCGPECRDDYRLTKAKIATPGDHRA